jgi:hypothetical protein
MTQEFAVTIPPKAPTSGAGRGASYPFITLEQAIARAKTLWDKEGKNLAFISAAVKHWGYAEKSSGGKQTVAALRAFGLIETEGEGDGRQIRLTGRALDILLDPDPAKKTAALRAAAAAPRIFSDLLAKWAPSALPSDETISAYLLREKDFNRNAVTEFVKDFRANIAYSGLANSVNIPLMGAPKGAKIEEEKPPGVQIGKFVQWAPGGIDQFVEPRKVVGFSEGKDFLFVEGSLTGVAVSEVTVMPDPATIDQSPLRQNSTAPIRTAPSGSKQDTFTLDEGIVVLQWPSSLSETSFEDFESWIQLQLKKIKRSVAN